MENVLGVSISNGRSQKKALLIVGALTITLSITAVVLSLLPIHSASDGLQWVLYMVGSGQWSISQGVGAILGALPGYIASSGAVIDAVWWVVTYVADYGVSAIAAAIADLTAVGGLPGLIIGIVGAAFLG